MSISKERREHMLEIAEAQEFFGGHSSPVRIDELRTLLDMADERGRYRALLREAHAELKHARVFISSREKMHPTGVEINDELVARIDAALEGKE